mmetsp:Transcript_21506/g.49172  ORF Transcript_21506/g.49172 Transcript_21506/m.49172 type:complete len:216 (+) Transcript_21506:61-708(+)
MGAELSNTCSGLCGGGADDQATENVHTSATSTATPRIDQQAAARTVVLNSDVSRLVGMGFSEREAREALTHAGGDFDQATALLVSAQEDEVEGEVQGEVEDVLLPPPPGGDFFAPPPPAGGGGGGGRNAENVQALVAMGFPEHQAKGALDRTGGNLEDAIQVLTGGEPAARGPGVNDEKVDQLVAMGFDRQKAALALQSTGGDVQMASAVLVSDG